MSRIFIFDVDNTLGRKTPLYPKVTSTNVGYLKQLDDDSDNLLLFATGRPRPQAKLAFTHGGLTPDQLYEVFGLGGIYEDGLFVEDGGGKVLYNAVEHAPELFRRIKDGFFDKDAQKFFAENGFQLFQGLRLRQNESGVTFAETYDGKGMDGTHVQHLIHSLIPLWQQGNDVRETYKTPVGYMRDSLDDLEPTFERVYDVAVTYLTQRFGEKWMKAGKLERWKDAVEVYPRLDDGEDVFRKGDGIERLMQGLGVSKNTPVYVCCDGRNDITLVRYVAERHPEYHVVCPSNVSSELKASLAEGSYRHTILDQDCDTFTEGLAEIVAKAA